jgi:hypothetical protein
LEKKWAARDDLPSQRITFAGNESNDYRAKNQYSSPYSSAKNENGGNEVASIGKLDNIQQRIKTILKQANY